MRRFQGDLEWTMSLKYGTGNPGRDRVSWISSLETVPGDENLER